MFQNYKTKKNIWWRLDIKRAWNSSFGRKKVMGKLVFKRMARNSWDGRRFSGYYSRPLEFWIQNTPQKFSLPPNSVCKIFNLTRWSRYNSRKAV